MPDRVSPPAPLSLSLSATLYCCSYNTRSRKSDAIAGICLLSRILARTPRRSISRANAFRALYYIYSPFLLLSSFERSYTRRRRISVSIFSIAAAITYVYLWIALKAHVMHTQPHVTRTQSVHKLLRVLSYIYMYIRPHIYNVDIVVALIIRERL